MRPCSHACPRARRRRRPEPVANFDFADGRGAEFHRRAHRVVVAHHIDEACVRIVERAARHLEHVIALVEHDAHRGALVLAQALGLIGEAHAAGDLGIAHIGRDAGHRADELAAVERDLGVHARPDLVGIGLGHLEFDFQRRQVHHRDQRRVLGHLGPFDLRQRGDDAGHRGLERERIDALAQSRDLQRLRIARRALAAQLELQAVLLQAAGFDGVRVVELGGLEIVARALEVAFRNHVDVPGVLRALELAFGGGDRHLGEIAVLAALEDLAPHFDDLAVEGGVGAREAGAFPFVFIGQRALCTTPSTSPALTTSPARTL